MADIIQFRRDNAAAWTTANPILADGEFGFEKDTRKGKIGDGVTTWNTLEYSFLPPEDVGGGGSIELIDYITAWYTIGASGLTGYVMNQGNRFYVPFTNMIYAKNDVNISKVAFRTSGSGSGGSTMRIGIYERTTLNNLSLLADLGTFSTDILNTIEYTFTNQLLTKGKLYYFVFQRDDTGGANAPTFQSWSNLFVDQVYMVAPASGDMWQISQALLKTSVTVGALASTDTLPTVSSNVGTPRIQFYLSNI